MNEPLPKTRVTNAWALAGELGLLIAIPLVVAVLGGIKLDAVFNTKPLFIILSMFFSAIISVIAVVRKVKRLSL